jgi:hypothetical protein
VEWVAATSLVDVDLHAIRGHREIARFCEHNGVPTRSGKTKAGRDHPQRREVDRRSFVAALNKLKAQERLLQDAADRTQTERERRASRQ